MICCFKNLKIYVLGPDKRILKNMLKFLFKFRIQVLILVAIKIVGRSEKNDSEQYNFEKEERSSKAQFQDESNFFKFVKHF